MITNPRLGQEVVFSSKIRNLFYKRAVVVRVDRAIVVQLKEDGTTFFVELDDEMDHVRGS